MLVRFGIPEDIVVNLIKALQARGDEIVAFEMQKEVCLCCHINLMVYISRLTFSNTRWIDVRRRDSRRE